MCSYSDRKINKLNHFIPVFFVYMALSTLNFYVGSRVVLLFSAMVVVFFLLGDIKSVIRYSIKNKIYLVLLACILITTLITVLIKDFEYSSWQLFRSHLWSIIIMPISIVTFAKIVNKEINYILVVVKVVELWVMLTAISIIIDYSLGTHVVISKIRAEDVGRVYALGDMTAVFFVPVFLYFRKYIALFSCYIIAYATGGKIVLVLSLMMTIFYFYDSGAFKRPSYYLVFSTIASLFIYIVLEGYGDRFLSFIDSGDYWRFSQVMAAYNMTFSDLYSACFGIGLGTPYWEGFYALTNSYIDPDLAVLFDNMRFDIESGIPFLVLRFGLVGFFIYAYLSINNWGRYNIIFIPIIIIWFMGASPSGISYAFSFMSFSIAAACYTKLKMDDESLRIKPIYTL
ncbi:hypothetical protein ADIMK_1472 [Marinobacterium lacunae]|uniref:Uncharacterized protein n=1 Tax=Marinobacterium lacunae TaxID=1232683 RepID=A0A081G0C1_9GAMM|nr:hypothetical protein [Marinobacterium lacunae]KEA64226.1 hypothetical protein ADIMK_1472 [Marinobacterium lacunae]